MAHFFVYLGLFFNMQADHKNASTTFLSNRKLKVFLFFLLLTTFIWFLVELSQSYNTKATFRIRFKDIPDKLFFEDNTPQRLDIVIKAPGFSLLTYKWSTKEISLSLRELQQNATGYYLLPNYQNTSLSAQLTGGTEVIRMLKDTLYVGLGKNKTQKLPVHLLLDLQFKLGYNLVEKLRLSPDSIVVKGPEKQLDSMLEIATQSLQLEEVYQDIDIRLPLVLPGAEKNVVTSAKEVRVTAQVEKFTEGVLALPVSIVNVPEGVAITPFPKEIKVVYRTGLSNFNKITPNSVRVVFDYKQYQKDTLLHYLSPSVVQQSEYISSIKIIPDRVEFLIQQP
ncbi:MAG: CdaR family protein [Lutibacter sp.]|jgi:hypothetical protein|nr:CdaR family protein [Lutibacter sp.]